MSSLNVGSKRSRVKDDVPSLSEIVSEDSVLVMGAPEDSEIRFHFVKLHDIEGCDLVKKRLQKLRDEGRTVLENMSKYDAYGILGEDRDDDKDPNKRHLRYYRVDEEDVPELIDQIEDFWNLVCIDKNRITLQDFTRELGLKADWRISRYYDTRL